MRFPIMLMFIVLSLSLFVASVIIGGILGAACLVVGMYIAVDVAVKSTPTAGLDQQTEETV